MANSSCLFCRYFIYLKPDEYFCQFQDKPLTTFTPSCPCFISGEVTVDE